MNICCERFGCAHPLACVHKSSRVGAIRRIDSWHSMGKHEEGRLESHYGVPGGAHPVPHRLFLRRCPRCSTVTCSRNANPFSAVQGLFRGVEMIKILSLVTLLSFFLSNPMVHAAEPDPVLGKFGDHVIRKSDMDRFISYHPGSEQKAIRKTRPHSFPAEKDIGSGELLRTSRRRRNFTKDRSERAAQVHR